MNYIAGKRGFCLYGQANGSRPNEEILSCTASVRESWLSVVKEKGIVCGSRRRLVFSRSSSSYDIVIQLTVKNLWKHCGVVSSVFLGIMSNAYPPHLNWDGNPRRIVAASWGKV